jgi:hypothetical protein
MRRIHATATMLLVPFLLTGCGDDDDNPTDPGDATPPEVVSSTPAAGATDVGLLGPIELEFSEAMDPASLDAETVGIEGSSSGLHLHYDAGAHRLVALPESLLAADSNLQLQIEGARDLAGNAMTAYTLDFSTGPFDCDHLADRLEPNDVIDAATPVSADTLIPALATCLTDVDWFSITVTDTTKVTATTYCTHSEKDPEGGQIQTSWAIYWYAGDSRSVATQGGIFITGGERSFHYSFLPGTYYLRLFGTNDEVDVLYDLRLETGPPCEDDQYEDNDFSSDAVLIEPGVHQLRGCYLDDDHFLLAIDAGQTLRATLDAPIANVFRALYVHEPSGEVVGSGTVYDDPIMLDIEALESGEGWVHLQFWDDDVDYQLTLEVID